MNEKTLGELLEGLAEEKKLNISELREEAFRLYFNLKPELKLEGVVVSYLKGKISLSRAAELAGITVPEFKEILASKGIIRETEGKNTSEMDKKIKEILE